MRGNLCVQLCRDVHVLDQDTPPCDKILQRVEASAHVPASYLPLRGPMARIQNDQLLSLQKTYRVAPPLQHLLFNIQRTLRDGTTTSRMGALHATPNMERRCVDLDNMLGELQAGAAMGVRSEGIAALSLLCK